MIKDNLQVLISKENLTVGKLSQLVEIKTGTFYSWTSGEREPSYEMLLQIKQKYQEKIGKNLNLDWLLTGKGEPFLSDRCEGLPDNILVIKVKRDQRILIEYED